jgi:hypothetical protein
MRTSPIAASIMMVARKKSIWNGAPLRQPVGLIEGLEAGDNVEECESDRDRQPGNIDTAGPRRRRAYGRQRRHDKVRRPQAAKNISGRTRAKPQDGGGDTHDEHGVDEQQPAAAVDRPALLRRESDGAKNNREPACRNVDW